MLASATRRISRTLTTAKLAPLLIPLTRTFSTRAQQLPSPASEQKNTAVLGENALSQKMQKLSIQAPSRVAEEQLLDLFRNLFATGKVSGEKLAPVKKAIDRAHSIRLKGKLKEFFSNEGSQDLLIEKQKAVLYTLGLLLRGASIEVLDLSHNDILEPGARALRRGLDHTFSCENLRLTNNLIIDLPRFEGVDIFNAFEDLNIQHADFSYNSPAMTPAAKSEPVTFRYDARRLPETSLPSSVEPEITTRPAFKK
jgi:hypothetical protein